MKRTFIAIDIIPADKLKEAYDLIRYRMRLERINWVPADHMHITLNFLGDTEDNLLSEIKVIAKGIADKHHAFEISLHSFGVFKSLKEPRVLWLGCEPSSALDQIKEELDESLAVLGFEPENRPFRPHLTVGRVKDIRQQNQLVQLITLFKNTTFQKQLINSIIIYESKLTPTGPNYVMLEKFRLK
jgi:2'-5' RNA ligase